MADLLVRCVDESVVPVLKERASPCPLHPTAPAAERITSARARSASRSTIRSTIRRVRMPGLVGLLLVSTALADGAALASSPDAWRAYDRQVRTACVAASRLAAARVKGKRVDVLDLDISALLLEGTYPQPHMRGQKGLELCLFERRSGRAKVADGDRLFEAEVAP
jgi:hypothetical protein